MDFGFVSEVLSDLLGVPIAAFAFLSLLSFVIKISKEKSDRSKSEKRENVKALIEQVEKHGVPKHHYLIEQVFHNRYEMMIDYPAISFFLKTKTPSRNLNLYSHARSYIEFSTDYKKIIYKDGFTRRKLKFKYYLTILGYGFFSVSGLGLIFMLPAINFNELHSLVFYLFFTLSMLLLAWLMLDENYRPTSAIELVEKYG